MISLKMPIEFGESEVERVERDLSFSPLLSLSPYLSALSKLSLWLH